MKLDYFDLSLDNRGLVTLHGRHIRSATRLDRRTWASLTLLRAPSSIAFASSWKAGEKAVDQEGKTKDMWLMESQSIIYIPRISTSSETGLASKDVLRNMTNDVSVGRGRF